jgi:hypothetical protein
MPASPLRRRTSHTRLPSRAALALGATAALTALAAVPASAATALTAASGPTVVASGLDNPRQLAVTASGDVYVAEAGRGGAGPCHAGPEGESCFGTTGAVTVAPRLGTQHRIVTGLPSMAAPDGSGAIGPSDVEPVGSGQALVLIGLGANPALRDTLPAAGRKLATLQLVGPGNSSKTLSDLGAFEARTNPIHDPDSNPVSIAKDGNGFMIADAGGNTVVRTDRLGRSSTVAVFDDQLATAPPFLGLPPGTKIPAQAVPTAAAKGPDGAWYVSQLTGFPFEPGLAKIYRVVPGHAPTVYASGLTNVTSLAWSPSGHLYAVQIADGGLLASEGLPMGSLLRITPGASSHTAVASPLPAPYGVAISGSSAYVSTCAVCPGGGQVMRIPLS